MRQFTMSLVLLSLRTLQTLFVLFVLSMSHKTDVTMLLILRRRRCYSFEMLSKSNVLKLSFYSYRFLKEQNYICEDML